MEKEKMIENLASLIANNDCGKHHNCSTCEERDYLFCQYQHLAVRLYDCGVKVVDDGAVVLTREEYERLKSDRKIKVVQHLDDEYTVEIPQCEYDEMLEQARKETAREYHDKMEQVIKERDYIEGYAQIGMCEENDEILKGFGEEVE